MIIPVSENIPEGFRTKHYSIKPSHPSDNARDYAAVMDSKAYLRLWSDSSWPEDNFSPEENRADLEMHFREHLERKAFGYNIHNHDQTHCHGSIYLNSTAFIAENYRPQLNGLDRFQIVVSMWTSDALREAGHAREMLSALRRWLAQDWPVEKVLYSLRANLELERSDYIACGLKQRWSLASAEGRVLYLFA